MEVGEDSTTSSASTNSTRRASSLTAPATPKLPNSDPSEPPSTPPEQVEEPASKASPGHQRDLHQKKRRRSSGIPPMNFNNPDDEGISSSPFSGSSVAGSDDTGHSMPAGQPDSSDSDSDVADGEDTGMSIVSQDATSESAGSASSTSSSTKLDQALRLAAVQAGTRGIEFDEHGDTEMEMEMVDEEITASFQPWVKKGVHQPKSVEDLSSLQGQENLNPFSPAFRAGTGSSRPQVPSQKEDETEEMSMDVTKAVGGILKAQSPKASPKASPKGRRKSIANARRSSIGRRRSDVSDMDDATMEFTTVVGGIQQKLQQAVSASQNDESALDEDEDMTMEFTGVIGGMISNQPHSATKQTAAHADTQENVSSPRRESIGSIMADDSMDMTAAVGGILAPIEERTEPQDTQTMAMDVTTAIGGILPPELHTNIKSQAKKLMELETDAGQLTSSPFQEKTSPISPPKSVPKSATPKHLATIASETGSPSLASVRTRGAGRKSGEGRLSATPKFSSQPGTPVKGPSTPSKQLTPLSGKPTTPGKTPPMSNVTFRSASPKKLFKAEIKKVASTPKSVASQKTSTPDKLFNTDAITGQATPSIILRPGRRRSSGLGIDKEGLGSPQVEALFDRRGSLGEDARKFIVEDQPTRGVHFDNPVLLSQELDLEREEQERRESGRGILERDADIVDQDQDDEEDRTANLKDMIQSMTPKKEHHYEAMYPKGKKPNGRKSIAPGGAKGLLGKRPVELDSDEEDADVDSTPKRLKGREGSPVKNVKLPTPAQNMGRMTRTGRKSVAAMTAADTITPTTFGSPTKSNPTATTPKHQGRFKDAEGPGATKPTSFEDKIDAADQLSLVDDAGLSQQEEEQERIHLQDFLNMTNIHFMELTTTKRRHTTAPGSAKKPSAFGQAEGAVQASLEDCVVAALCTVPMLELYQHVRFPLPLPSISQCLLDMLLIGYRRTVLPRVEVVYLRRPAFDPINRNQHV
jgi:kinetochore protein Spc7/SPC105